MTKIEAVIRVDAVETVIEKLGLIGVSGITKTEVEGHGKQKGIVEQFRGKEYRLPFIPKIKLEIVVKDLQVDDVINTVINCCQTGEIGDGKIFILNLEECIRIRTGEKGNTAIG